MCNDVDWCGGIVSTASGDKSILRIERIKKIYIYIHGNALYRCKQEMQYRGTQYYKMERLFVSEISKPLILINNLKFKRLLYI